jgi:hypothetical protein
MPGLVAYLREYASLYCALAETGPRHSHNVSQPIMKQLVRAVGIALSTALIFSHSAMGQKTYAVGVGGGVAIPAGKLRNTQKTGYNGTVTLAIGVSELPVGVRFDGIYNTFPLRSITAGTSTSSDLRIIGALGNLIFAFSGTSAKPYVVFGGGYYGVKVNAPGAKTENNFGFNAGLGATLGVGPLAMFFESRYHSISRTAANGGVIQFIPITVGLMF